jgi:glycosyltransferase involved in cell wall biosynthesis
MHDKVSILIPCYNAAEWVGDAIRSALAQTWPNKEVIVVDDGSTDASLSVIRSFGDAIRYETGPNRGGNVARNRLLELASGQWLQYLDADDYLLPDKISGQLAAVTERRAAHVIYSPMTLEIWKEGRALRRIELPIPAPPRDPWVLLARWQMPGTHAVLLRRSALAEAGGWKPDQPCCQEHEVFLRLLAANKQFGYAPRAGAIYRHWSSGTVSTRDPRRTITQRLIIVDRLLAHLRKTNQMTPARADAIAQARVECARSLYQIAPEAARGTVRDALQNHPRFRLPVAPSFPAGYRALFGTLGFDVAERFAEATRSVRRMAHRCQGSVQSSSSPDSNANRAATVPPAPSVIPADRMETAAVGDDFHRAAVVKKSAKVSILIPCCNAERWIDQAIRSALEQTWPNKEVLVVDDGSTDRSLEIIQSFGDAIRFETGPNRGGNVARNRLLELSSGQWLQYLDADDYLLPEKIERQLGELKSPDEVDVAYAPVIMECWGDNEIVGHGTQNVPEDPLPWVRLVRWELPQTGAALWRRSAIIDVGGWKNDQPCCQEHELYFRLLSAGKTFQFCTSHGAVYRQWSMQTVCRKDPKQTITRRLAIVDAVERRLIEMGMLNSVRQDAIALTRLECARSLYQLDRTAALDTATLAARQHPSYQLTPLPCFPRMYRWLYQMGGFRAAELIAGLARPIRMRRMA